MIKYGIKILIFFSSFSLLSNYQIHTENSCVYTYDQYGNPEKLIIKSVQTHTFIFDGFFIPSQTKQYCLTQEFYIKNYELEPAQISQSLSVIKPEYKQNPDAIHGKTIIITKLSKTKWLLF